VRPCGREAAAAEGEEELTVEEEHTQRSRKIATTAGVEYPEAGGLC